MKRRLRVSAVTRDEALSYGQPLRPPGISFEGRTPGEPRHELLSLWPALQRPLQLRGSFACCRIIGYMSRLFL